MVTTITNAGTVLEIVPVGEHEAAITETETETPIVLAWSQHSVQQFRQRRSNRWVTLDSTWANRLGVRRTAGIYRIRSRDLISRLSQHQPPGRP
jgi:hypothetical protein